jgi:hypothetical protein
MPSKSARFAAITPAEILGTLCSIEEKGHLERRTPSGGDRPGDAFSGCFNRAATRYQCCAARSLRSKSRTHGLRPFHFVRATPRSSCALPHVLAQGHISRHRTGHSHATGSGVISAELWRANAPENPRAALRPPPGRHAGGSTPSSRTTLKGLSWGTLRNRHWWNMGERKVCAYPGGIAGRESRGQQSAEGVIMSRILILMSKTCFKNARAISTNP